MQKRCASLQLSVGADIGVACGVAAGAEGARVDPRVALVSDAAPRQLARFLLQALKNCRFGVTVGCC